MDISFNALKNCRLCPRNCGVDRFSDNRGYCNSDFHYNVNSIVAHHGEEPPISGKHGICNVFFNHCNMQCIFCQNYQISSNSSKNPSKYIVFEKLLADICKHLDSGCKAIGFVSPSHQIPQMLSIIKAFENYKPKPVFVYNTNAYDKVDTLKELEGFIDIYLPDFKYMDEKLSLRLSDASDYPETSRKALKEIFRQKGSALHFIDEQHASSGMIIRHLVLPGYIQNSIDVLHFIAEELSPKVHISLMSQYYPAGKASAYSEINKTLNKREYDSVLNEMEKLGLTNGWIQELDSNKHYRPDFENSHPFE